ncbi:MAG: SCO family protein [Acidobacteria bacterium]|nr:SCO family protein [Acidobacteriota bacterium]
MKVQRQFAAIVFVILAFCVSANAKRQTPADVIKSVGFDQKLDEQLPLDATFRDEAGKEIALHEYFGRKPVLVAFVYYDCPMLCTMELNGIVKTLRAVSMQPARDFEVVIVSFDPKETAALAAEKKNIYLKFYARGGTDAGWHFLTGDAKSIERTTQAAGFRFAFDDETKQYAHVSGILIATPEGKISRYFYGIEYAPRDVKLGLVEASSGKIGSLADHVLLFCYHYDPKTGKYSFMIMSVVRALGIATVALIVGFILFNLWRERRREPSIKLGHA